MFLRTVHFAIALATAASSFSKAESLSPRSDTALLSPMSLKSIHDDDSMVLLERYQMGRPGAQTKATVEIYSVKSAGTSLAKRNSTTEMPGITKPLDMTPSTCTSQVCYPGSFEGPKKTDCDVVVDAQLYHSVGSLRSKPGQYVLVYSGTCVVVFQHPMGKGDNKFVLEYNWANLGKIMVDIQKQCDKPESLSIGGVCKIEHYLKYTFENVLISLQRYVAPEKPQKPITSGQPDKPEKPDDKPAKPDDKPANPDDKPANPDKPQDPAAKP
ncbi:hypothetical protein PGT21_033551 [Puccinia graminis f. sp. tritici]|uniref:Uncharacterized protein n=1 Tax=Puccinia graminis f. sp. tritici TaxID=56615 RepID=A0A5B0QJU3_PUCGR|nr:hypothetical protein PGT21_033551 [Puccinia graminis f. sp. tritici]KAA1130868.1 hypothetical protein PGTUg99_027281 [Puccinia graminis f. sp. tritici]